MNKSKLNEFCQRSGWGLPMYSCIKDGEDHNPHFRGSVFVNGLTFVSETIAKSTKAAQNEAAQLALSHFLNGVATAGNPKIGTKKVPNIDSCNSDLNKGISSKTADFGTPAAGEKAKEKSTPASELPASGDSQVTVTTPDLSALSISERKPKKAIESHLRPGISNKTADFGSPTPAGEKAKEKSTPAFGDSQVTVTTPDLSALSISERKSKTAIESHLLGNRVRVYTSFPDVDLPKGTVVLPISDDKWAVVSLDFPNEIAT